MNEYAAVEELLEAVSSMWSVLTLYNEDQLDKPVSWISGLGVSSHELLVSVGSFWLAVRNFCCWQLRPSIN
jgi:hypothetical protein